MWVAPGVCCVGEKIEIFFEAIFFKLSFFEKFVSYFDVIIE